MKNRTNHGQPKTWKILTVSYIDDNFGDNLIRICFGQLLKVVFDNLGLSPDCLELRKMSIREVEEALVADSDIIAFAGGGLFGLSYLNFFDALNRITELADQHDIPLIFSSMGINNMDATPENEHRLQEILGRQCIKAVSVRENLELFKQYARGGNFEICQVCDPAVWTKYVYYSELQDIPPSNLMGINVVRGGIFNDNGKPWKLGDEMKYLRALQQELDSRGMDYVFYTNGSFLDDNSLHFFADKYDIPAHQLVYPNTTREFVRTVARFDNVASIRMHSSIVAYALGRLSINLIWNDKIPFFYENIGYADRAIALEHWNGADVFARLQAIKEEDYPLDGDYMMTLYRYLYRVMNRLTGTGADENTIFDLATVKAKLQAMTVSRDEDITDYNLKPAKSEKHYLSRYKEVNQKDSELNRQAKEMDKQAKTLAKKDKEITKLKKSLDKINRLPSVKLTKAIYRMVKKIRKA